MSKTKSFLWVLLTATLLLAGCQRNNVGETFASDSDTINNPGGSITNPYASGSANYDPNAKHGEKAVYGYALEGVTYNRRETLNSWGNFYFQWNWAWMLCYDQTGQSVPAIPCFDPLCNHEVDTCPAFYQFDEYKRPDGMTNSYPFYIFLDYYDNANSPVFYSVYRRSSVGHLGTENFNQKPYYLIQRYDLASGERVTLQSEITELIHSVYTYGDNLYYTISEDYFGKKKLEPGEGTSFTLCMLPKTGGEPKLLQDKNTKSLDILDITDDGVYYLINSRYIYRCSPTLENPELLLDIDSVKDGNGNHVRLASVRNGYYFYFGDLVPYEGKYEGLYEADGSCYRAPLNDPTNAVKIAEHMVCTTSFLMFTENFLYYMPTVMEEVTNNGNLYPFNYSNGTVKAVNLFTGETVTCCEDTGISFITGLTDRDNITVFGQAYEEKGQELGSVYKHIRLYPDGRPAELCFDMSTRDEGFVIGSWNE